MGVRKCGVAIVRAMKRTIRVRNGSSRCKRWIIRPPAVCRSSARSQVHNVFLRGGARQLTGELPLAHDQDAIGYLDQLRKLRAHHQDGRTGTGQAIHFFEDFLFCAHVDSARGFVEEKNTAPRATHLAMTIFC